MKRAHFVLVHILTLAMAWNAAAQTEHFHPKGKPPS